MVQSNDPRHESAQARERLSAIANELAARTTPEHLKRATKTMAVDAKDNLKGKAMEQRNKMVDNVRRNPVPWGAAVGGLAGVLAGAIARRMAAPAPAPRKARPIRRTSPVYEFASTRMPDEGAHFSIADGKEVDCDADFSEQLKSMNGSGKTRARRFFEASGEHPVAIALFGLGVGVAAAIALPQSKLERTELGKVRRRLSEGLAEMGRELESRLDRELQVDIDPSIPTTENTRRSKETRATANKGSPSLH